MSALLHQVLVDAIEFVFDEEADYRIRLTADASDDCCLNQPKWILPLNRATIVVNDNVGQTQTSKRLAGAR